MTTPEMLAIMNRLDARASGLLLTGASDVELLGGMFDLMLDFKALLDAGYGSEIEGECLTLPGAPSLRHRSLGHCRGDRGRIDQGPALIIAAHAALAESVSTPLRWRATADDGEHIGRNREQNLMPIVS